MDDEPNSITITEGGTGATVHAAVNMPSIADGSTFDVAAFTGSCFDSGVSCVLSQYLYYRLL